MCCNRRDVLRAGTSTLAVAGIGQLLNGLLPRASAAAPNSDLSPYDAMGLAELIRTKQITPLEVIEDTIRKIEAVNSTLNAVVFKTYDHARQRASEPLSGAVFAGVPLLVKDNATIAGITDRPEDRARCAGTFPTKRRRSSRQWRAGRVQSSWASPTCPR